MEVLDFLRDFNYATIVLRLILAIIIGGIIGNERGKHGSAAGLRTHILVCLGSAMTALTSFYVYETLGISGDVLRLSAQVISGIGFLGAGMIIVKNSNVVIGLTTAAGMWATAAIGIAIGFGFYVGAILATLISVFTAAFLSKLEASRKNVVNIYVEADLSENSSEFINGLKRKFEGEIHIEIVSPKSNVQNIIGFRITLYNTKLLDDINECLKNTETIKFFLIQ